MDESTLLKKNIFDLKDQFKNIQIHYFLSIIKAFRDIN